MEKRETWYSSYYKEKTRKHFEQQRKNKEEIEKSSIITKAGQEVKDSLIELPGIIENPEKILKKVAELRKLEINKKFLVFLSVLVLAGVIFLILFFTSPPLKARFQPLDLIAGNSSGLPMNFYFKDSKIGYISGWESKLSLGGKEDRLFGNQEYRKLIFDEKGRAYTAISLDNEIRIEPLKESPEKVIKIGWFAKPENINIKEKTGRREKQVLVEIKDENSELKKASLNYKFYKNKPYFKLQFSAEGDITQNSSSNFAYGFVLKDYDVYLENGTILKNDNQITSLNKSVDLFLYENNKTSKISKTLVSSIEKEIDTSRQALTRQGSSYKVPGNSSYELFYNQNLSLAIIVYSPDVLYFENSFMWNVFRVYVPYDKEGYPALYFIFVEAPQIKFKDGKWQIASEQFAGDIKFYINQVISEIEEI